MFHSSYVHLLEMIAFQCRLLSHFYLREVAGDGSVLGGVEIEVAVVQQGASIRGFSLGVHFGWLTMPLRRGWLLSVRN